MTLGWVHLKTKSILPSLIVHIGWNAYHLLVLNFAFEFIPRW
ncbi:hypothetical protein [Halobacillus salinus]